MQNQIDGATEIGRKKLSANTIIVPISDTPTEHSIDSTPSTLLTKAWYGTSKLIAGQTAYSIYMELHANGKLKADYNTNVSEAMNRLNDAAAERLTKKDLLAADKQEKIALLFTTSHEINAEFALAKALAIQYLEPQKKALTYTLQKQANIIEPQLKEERDEIIKQAHNHYTQELGKQLVHAKNAASNSRYLHSKAQNKDVFDLHSEHHFQDLKTYSALLATINADTAKK